MTFRTFFYGLFASFGLPWLLVVVVPFLKMRDLKPLEFKSGVDTKEGIYHPKRTGRVANGAAVYAANGCYQCHTQVVRPTYAGNDLFRPDWGGLKATLNKVTDAAGNTKGVDARGEAVDTRRETNAWDFQYEKFAHIGVSRVGPDLANLGRRVEAIYAPGGSPENWLYAHLYNPRHEVERSESACPPMPFLFEVRKVAGARADDALPFPSEEGTEIVPGNEAKELVSYLLSLKKDDVVPAALNFGPKTKSEDKKAAAPAAK